MFIPDHFIFILVAILLIIFVIYLTLPNVTEINYNTSNKQTNKYDEIIKTLVRQATRYSNASLQDKTPLISVLHANYGAGYWFALNDVFTTDQIQKVIHSDPLIIRDKITNIQDNATKKLVNACPNVTNGIDIQLSKLAGEFT